LRQVLFSKRALRWSTRHRSRKLRNQPCCKQREGSPFGQTVGDPLIVYVTLCGCPAISRVKLLGTDGIFETVNTLNSAGARCSAVKSLRTYPHYRAPSAESPCGFLLLCSLRSIRLLLAAVFTSPSY
ncbi:unnamed protein product, partial [Ectocarpus sp. 13 AM-2016]